MKSEIIRTQLVDLSDDALWQAARRTMTKQQRDRMEALAWQQQRSGLNAEEKVEADALLELYRETLLIRAQSVALLQGRDYDVSDPTQFHSLDESDTR